VGHYHTEAVLDDRGDILGKSEGHAGGSRGALVSDEGMNILKDPESILSPAFLHFQQGGPLTVDQDSALLVLEAFLDVGDVAKPQFGAGRRRDHHDIGDFLGTPTFVGKTHQKLLLIRAYRSGRQIETLAF